MDSEHHDSLVFHGEPEAQDRLIEALAKASESFDSIPKDKTVEVRMREGKGTYTFSYAPLSTIMRHVRPKLREHGVLIMTPFYDGPEPDNFRISVVLAGHGARIEAHTTYRRSEMNMRSVQDFGKLLTYLRRYATQGILAIEGDRDVDDDGTPMDAPSPGKRKRSHPAQPPKEEKPRPSKEQIKAISAELQRLSLSPRDAAEICKEVVGVASLAEANPKQAADLLAHLQGLTSVELDEPEAPGQEELLPPAGDDEPAEDTVVVMDAGPCRPDQQDSIKERLDKLRLRRKAVPVLLHGLVGVGFDEVLSSSTVADKVIEALDDHDAVGKVLEDAKKSKKLAAKDVNPVLEVIRGE